MSERFELCDKCSAATGRCGRADDSLYAGDFGPYCEDCWEDLREDLAADVAALEARAKDDALQHLADIGQLHDRIAALEAENKAMVTPLPPECAPKGVPVLVAGGIAMKKTGGQWFTGMAEPAFERLIEWEVKWWSPIPQQNQPPARAAPALIEKDKTNE